MFFYFFWDKRFCGKVRVKIGTVGFAGLRACFRTAGEEIGVVRGQEGQEEGVGGRMQGQLPKGHGQDARGT